MSDDYDHLPVPPEELAELLDEIHADTEDGVEASDLIKWLGRHPADDD